MYGERKTGEFTLASLACSILPVKLFQKRRKRIQLNELQLTKVKASPKPSLLCLQHLVSTEKSFLKWNTRDKKKGRLNRYFEMIEMGVAAWPQTSCHGLIWLNRVVAWTLLISKMCANSLKFLQKALHTVTVWKEEPACLLSTTDM